MTITAMPLTTQTGHQQTSDDLQQCIIGMIAAMKADFGHKFKSQFGSGEDLRQYKRRLYSMLKGNAIDSIETAYNAYAIAGNEWPPTVPQLLAEIGLVEKQKNRDLIAEQQHHAVLRLQKPTRECNPMQMLADANLSKTADNRTKEQWMHDKQTALLKLQSVVSSVPRRYADANHLCGHPDCTQAGTISGSVRGGEHWYCKNHFRA